MTLTATTWCETCWNQTHDAVYDRIYQANGVWNCHHGETAPIGATTKPPIPADWTNNPHQF